MRVSRIRQATAADQVREALLRRVESGEFAVGDKLPTEAELAAAFGVSRAVIREALGSARATGALRSYRGRGTFVASERPQNLLLLGRYQTDDLHEIRRDLEVPGAAQAAVRRSPEDCDRLLELVTELEREGDLDKWVTLDAAFHVAIARAGGNSVRLRLVDDLRDLLVVLSLNAANVGGRKEGADLEHREIYEAIRAGDADRAREAMQVHLDQVTESLHAESETPDAPARRRSRGAS